MKNSLKLNEQRLLLFSIFVLSLCGIIYELVLGSLATYLLGNPVQQYSITIGVFLSSMGLGSYLSRFLKKNILKKFIFIEVVLGLVGGISVLLLNFSFSFSISFYLFHLFFLIIIGTLVGLEIPLLTRILKEYGSLKLIISNVLTLDYMGGLAGSLLFPLLLFPLVGRIVTSLLIGIVNIGVATIIIIKIDYKGKKKEDYLFPFLSLILLSALLIFSGEITDIMQKRLFYDDIVYSKRSKFQEIILTRNGDDFRLYLDGSIQFSTSDEYRYHEMLIFPSLSLNSSKKKAVLVLGGGDGLAVKYILEDSSVEKIVLVELDEAIINLAKYNSSLKRINKNSLYHKKVEVVVGDAYKYLIDNKLKFDVIIADFPDPHDEAIAKLYSVEFFHLVKRALNKDGIFVTQSTSPLFANEAFWCINKTMESIFKNVIPYHVFIPSFGDWGFNIASNLEIDLDKSDLNIKPGRFYSKEGFKSSTYFSKDIAKVDVKVNSFNKPIVYHYYIRGWQTTDY